jgi:hypothetical protein
MCSGNVNLSSSFALSGTATVLGSPPVAGTICNGALLPPVEKTIASSTPQLPLGVPLFARGSLQMSIGAPPAIETFLSSKPAKLGLTAKNAIHCPSG